MYEIISNKFSQKEYDKLDGSQKGEMYIQGKIISVLGILIIILPIFVAYVSGSEISLSWFLILCLVVGIILLIVGIVSELKNKNTKKS